MDNHAIARVLKEIGEYIEMQEGNSFRAKAYAKAAEVVGESSASLATTYKAGGTKALIEISGIGAGIAQTIGELVDTGKSKVHADLRKAAPVDLSALRAVEGLGPQKIRKLYEGLGVASVAELERAAREGKIRGVEGFGEKSEEKIIRAVEFLKTGSGRFRLGDVLPWARATRAMLASVHGVSRVEIAGSMRRRKETVGDADFLAIAGDSQAVMDRFVAMPDVAHILMRGDTKASVRLANGLQADLRVVPEESYGAALNYFTGSRDHNIILRQAAQERGMKLNEYGLFKGEKLVAGDTEEGIYQALGLPYIEPELREASGETQAGLAGTLPALIGYGDLMGDLQVQTDWSDGAHSIEEMARAAHAVGLSYMVVTDHTKRLAMTGGLDARRVRLQGKEIDRVNVKLKTEKIPFTILKGTECDILKDGSLDLPDNVLSELDVVGVSVHSYFTLPRAEQTARIARAMKNPHTDILFHPTGRKILARPACDIDMNQIIRIARETGTVLEVDAFPDRLDLSDAHIRAAIKEGVKIAIDSDAHDKAHFSVLEYGIAQARRGWACREDAINAWPLERMKRLLKKP